MRRPTSPVWGRTFATISAAVLILPLIILAVAAMRGNDTDSTAFGFAFTLLVIVPCSGVLAVLAIAALVLRLTHADHPGRLWWIPLAAATVWVLGFIGLFLGPGL